MTRRALLSLTGLLLIPNRNRRKQRPGMPTHVRAVVRES